MKKSILYLLVIVICLSCTPKTKDSSSLKGFFAAIIVNNIENSIGWYESNLGFKMINKTDNEAFGLKQANLFKDNCHLELIALKSAIDARSEIDNFTEKTKLVGLFKIGFKVNQFDSLVKRLKDHDIRFKGDVVTDPVTDQRMVIVLDPDGNRIQLFDN